MSIRRVVLSVLLLPMFGACAPIKPLTVGSDGYVLPVHGQLPPRRPMWVDPSYKPQDPTRHHIGPPVNGWMAPWSFRCLAIKSLAPPALVQCAVVW